MGEKIPNVPSRTCNVTSYGASSEKGEALQAWVTPGNSGRFSDYHRWSWFLVQYPRPQPRPAFGRLQRPLGGPDTWTYGSAASSASSSARACRLAILLAP